MLEVSGRSDDLVYIVGDVNEEIGAFDASTDHPIVLAVSDGTVLAVWYDDEGFWRVHRRVAGSLRYKHTPADGDEYTDYGALSGIVEWVVVGSDLHAGKKSRKKARR